MRGMRVSFIVGSILLAAGTGGARAAGPELVKDINQTPAGYSGAETAVAGATFFYTPLTAIHGGELWKSDGTAAGTTLVKDIRPGQVSSFPGSLTDVNGTLFFAADDGIDGFELWKSDGTGGGTVLVKDIQPGAASSFPGGLANIGGTLYFAAEGAGGRELWKSDSTTAGTSRVKNISPGGDGSNPRHLTDVGGTLFFTANDGTSGRELWKSDGTGGGTVRVKDINPGGASGIGINEFQVGDFTDVAGTLFFVADDGTSGEELWKSDGTAAGTVLVKDVEPGNGGGLSHGAELVALGSLVLFSADDGSVGTELWKSDGTAAGTVLVADIDPGQPGSFPFVQGITDDHVFLSAITRLVGSELWAMPRCPAHRDLEGQSYSTVERFEATLSISTENVTVEALGSVTLQAPTIELRDGTVIEGTLNLISAAGDCQP